jgi:hypothetical protein
MTDIVYAPVQRKTFTALTKYALAIVELEKAVAEANRWNQESTEAFDNLAYEVQEWLSRMTGVELMQRMHEIVRDWHR